MHGPGAVGLLVACVVLARSNDLLKVRVNSEALRAKASEPLLAGDRFSRLGLMAFVTTFLAPITLFFS